MKFRGQSPSQGHHLHLFSYRVDNKFVDFFVLSEGAFEIGFFGNITITYSIKRAHFFAVQSNKDEKTKLLCWVFLAGLFVFDGKIRGKYRRKQGLLRYSCH